MLRPITRDVAPVMNQAANHTREKRQAILQEECRQRDHRESHSPGRQDPGEGSERASESGNLVAVGNLDQQYGQRRAGENGRAVVERREFPAHADIERVDQESGKRQQDEFGDPPTCR